MHDLKKPINFHTSTTHIYITTNTYNNYNNSPILGQCIVLNASVEKAERTKKEGKGWRRRRVGLRNAPVPLSL